MSLIRLVYHSGVIGGWAALVGWMLAEWLYYRNGSAEGVGELAVVGGLVGAAIGLGLNVVAGMANGQWKQLVFRAVPGLAAAALAGAVGTTVGEGLFRLGLPRACGWMILGLGVGAVEGLYDLAPRKLRNGLIGGALGGLLGGVLFDPIRSLVGGSGMSSRAAGFVILGLAVGALIGLAQVVFREAWLTVLDGYRAGRQLILSQPVTCLGRGDHLPLPFLGPMNAELEPEHTRIARQADGSYIVEDNHSRLGTRLNNQVLSATTLLKDGDVIKLATNFVRFNERRHRGGDAPAIQAGGFQGQVRPAPPPPRPTAPLPAKPSTASGKPAAGPATPSKPATPAAKPPSPPGPSRSGGIQPPPPPRRPKH